MQPTATSDCRTCRGRKGCRIAAPTHPSITVDFLPLTNDSLSSARFEWSDRPVPPYFHIVAFTYLFFFTKEKDYAMMEVARHAAIEQFSQSSRAGSDVRI